MTFSYGSGNATLRVGPEAVVHLVSIFDETFDDSRGLLEQRTELSSLGIGEIRDRRDVPDGLDDQRGESEGTDAVLDAPVAAFVDQPTRKWTLESWNASQSRGCPRRARRAQAAIKRLAVDPRPYLPPGRSTSGSTDALDGTRPGRPRPQGSPMRRRP